MKKHLGFPAVFLLTVSLAVAESTFVDINNLDEVFQHYDKEGKVGWDGFSTEPKPKKVKGGSVLASTFGAVPLEDGEMAFDGKTTTKYCTLKPTMWLRYEFADGEKRIESYAISSANDFPARDPKNWTLQGSNDGKKWVVLDERADEAWSKRFERRQFNVQKPGDYAFYKLDVTKNHGEGTSQISELELLTKEETIAAAERHKEKGLGREWQPLFAPDLSNAQFPEGVWTVENGEITASEDRLIISKQEYENFVLDLEFKNGPAANSGVFVYLTDPKGWVQNSVEIQITDDHSDKWKNAGPTWKCGAIFGRLAATETAVKPAGEWNHYTIICRGPFIDVLLNGVHVNSMDKRKWDSPTHNPDGSQKPPWLSKPLKDQPTKGRIGFQGKHGGAPIWFRNIRIKSL